MYHGFFTLSIAIPIYFVGIFFHESLSVFSLNHHASRIDERG